MSAGPSKSCDSCGSCWAGGPGVSDELVGLVGSVGLVSVVGLQGLVSLVGLMSLLGLVCLVGLGCQVGLILGVFLAI